MTRLFLLFTLVSLACGSTLPASIRAATPTIAAKTQQEVPQVISTPASCGIVTAARSLNLRDAPSDKAATDKDGLRRGDVVTITDERDGWYSVTTRDGRSGWVNGKYIEECK